MYDPFAQKDTPAMTRTGRAFRPLHFPDHAEALGAVSWPVADHLLRKGLLRDHLRLSLPTGDPTAWLEDIRAELCAQGWIESPRAENMPVMTGPKGTEIAELDRSALRILGFWAQKVHVNGLVPATGDAPARIWISRRSRKALSNPGRWDTLIAGGRAVGHSLLQTACKEGWEEAGITADHCADMVLIGDIAVQYVSDRGFHQELLVIYDLPLAPDFQAICHDDEIEESISLPHVAIAARLAEQKMFKFSSYLVLADLMARLEPCQQSRFAKLQGEI
jgi:8-oxo-dGTP pyrophosphatase MutT (NUDIX family)